jgi:hypothetical protein
MVVVNLFEALILASVFYNLQSNTSTFFSRGTVMFMIVLLNALGSMVCSPPSPNSLFYYQLSVLGELH